MDLLKNTAMLTGIFTGLLPHPGWLCLAVLLFTLPKTIEAVAKLVEALSTMRGTLRVPNRKSRKPPD